MKESLKKYKKFSPFLTATSIFLGMGLIVWFGIVPLQRHIIDKADGIQEYHATRENQEEQLQKLPDLKKQFENIQREENVLGILLSDNQVVNFVQTLERLAVETGVQVVIHSKNSEAIEEKKSMKAPVKKTVIAEGKDDENAETKNKTQQTLLESVPFDRYLHVDIVVRGEYQTIVAFLHKMETLSLGLDVIGISMKVREMEEPTTRPDNPSRNPFLILGEGMVTDPPSSELNVESIPGTLEASFDTVVYLDNK